MEVTKASENDLVDFVFAGMLHESFDSVESKLEKEKMEALGYARCVDRDLVIRYVDSRDILGF